MVRSQHPTLAAGSKSGTGVADRVHHLGLCRLQYRHLALHHSEKPPRRAAIGVRITRRQVAVVGRLDQPVHRGGSGVNYRRPVSPGRISVYVVLLLGATASLLPFVYMLMTSFKSYSS